MTTTKWTRHIYKADGREMLTKSCISAPWRTRGSTLQELRTNFLVAAATLALILAGAFVATQLI
jgi:hypothetical protein